MTEPNDLKGELAQILALSEKATPGEWVAKWSKYRKSEFLVQTAHPSNRVLATFDDDGEGAGEQSVADGELMAAAVNFLRTHGARLKRALEDEEYFRVRLAEVLPLLEEARDALPAISQASMRLHNVSPSLADRMDAAGTRVRTARATRRKIP